jgi:2-polyprenyl-3-methyl-5-hydroxy-6-metoxy-1,4-benzoquinol methylase/uncharacterized protein YbaR (Trm112 family)
MKNKIAEILACPACRGDLKLEVFEDESAEIKSGVFKCECGAFYPIIDFIPRMLPPSVWVMENAAFYRKFKKRLPEIKIKKNIQLNKIERRNRDSFSFEWKVFHKIKIDPMAEKFFYDFLGFDRKILKNKFVLDGGCGVGWYSRIAHQNGAEVVGVDFGRGVEIARKDTPKNYNINYVQGDLMNLPFKENTFDISFAYGVLMHTKIPARAVKNLAISTKPGGIVVGGSYSKTKKAAIGRFIWEFFRIFTKRMPHKMLFYISYIAIPLSHVPLLRHVCYPGNYPYFNRWRRVGDMFDWYHPHIMTYHSIEDVRSWFKSTGLLENISNHWDGYVFKGYKKRSK